MKPTTHRRANRGDKKLSLHKITIRQLTQIELAAAAGGSLLDSERFCPNETNPSGNC